MNRKFRAWDSLNNKMLSAIDIEDRTLRELDGDNDQIYLQYTGLKDKNGTEIFQGDVVSRVVAGETEIGIVKFGEVDLETGYPWAAASQALCFYVDGWEGCGGEVGLHSCEKPEVIGNIYENPELLKP